LKAVNFLIKRLAIKKEDKEKIVKLEKTDDNMENEEIEGNQN
jgi:hypothetical protein